MTLKVTGWTRSPSLKWTRAHPSVVRHHPPRLRFDLYSHQLYVRLGQRLFHRKCHVLRANHRVMDRTSAPLEENA